MNEDNSIQNFEVYSDYSEITIIHEDKNNEEIDADDLTSTFENQADDEENNFANNDSENEMEDGINGWRVKLYQLDSEGAWQDQGTGLVSCKFVASKEGPAIVVTNDEEENSNNSNILLESKIKFDDAYDELYVKQGASIIMWKEEDDIAASVDYALSFQDTEGCNAIWDIIREIQCQHIQKRYDHIPTLYRDDGLHQSRNTTTETQELPECNAENLIQIREILSSISPSQREYFATCILNNDGEFLNRLITIFGNLEDLDDNDNLCLIAEICRCILTLNDPTLIELIISDKMFINIAGIMEFDPLLKSKGDYRVYLSSQVQFRQVVPITNLELKNSIDTLFRLKFTRDILLRPSFDESGMSALNSMIVFANSDICSQIFESIEYLSLVIKAIDSNVDVSCFVTIDENSPTEDIENNEIKLKTRDSGLSFLRELFNMTRSLNFEKRIGLINEMLKSLQIPFFTMVKSVLASDNCTENERTCIAEVIISVTLTSPASVRQVILEGPIPSYPSHVRSGRVQQHQNLTILSQNNQCLLYLMIQRIVEENNSAVIEHLGDSIKILLDPERIDRRDKEKFLGVFYDYYMQWLLVPFVEPNIPDQPTHSRYIQDKSAIATSRRFIFEILSFCGQFHAYRMKCFVMRNSVIQRVTRIFDSQHRHFYLSAIRFIRTIISSKDEVYFRYIVKFDLLKTIMLLLQKCSKKDNLLTSTIIEMIDYIRTESLKTLIDYIVEKYSSIFDGIDHVDVFNRLKLKYEQSRDDSMSNGVSNNKNDYSGDSGSESDISLNGKRKQSLINKNSSIQNRRFIEQDNEEAYFNDDDDDDDDDEDDSFLENNLDNSQISSKKKLNLNNPLSMISQYGDDVDNDEGSFAEFSIINSSVNNQSQNMNGEFTSQYASDVIKSLCQKRVSEDMFSTDENVVKESIISKNEEINQYGIDDYVPLPPQRCLSDDGDLPSSAFLAGKNSKNNVSNSSINSEDSKKKSEVDNNGVSLIRFSMKPTKKSRIL